VQTVCRPISSGAVLQQPSRKKPVSGCSEQGASGSPSTLSLASNGRQPKLAAAASQLTIFQISSRYFGRAFR